MTLQRKKFEVESLVSAQVHWARSFLYLCAFSLTFLRIQNLSGTSKELTVPRTLYRSKFDADVL